MLTFVIPVAGGALLHGIRSLFSDQNRFLSNSTINLFMLSSGVKPLMHAVKLLKARSLHLQQIVHTLPSAPDDVDFLRDHVANLEDDIETMRRALSSNATKTDVRTMSKNLEPQFAQLGKAVRRYERREEYSRLETEERFNAMESKLGELDVLTKRASQLLQIEGIDLTDYDSGSPAHKNKMILQGSYSPRRQLYPPPFPSLAGHVLQRDSPDTQADRWYLRGPSLLVLLPFHVMGFTYQCLIWAAHHGSWRLAGSQRGLPLLTSSTSVDSSRVR